MKNLLYFVTGAAIGSVVTWKLIEKKYKDLADEEIESVKETFKNRKQIKINDKETSEKFITKYKDSKVKIEDIVSDEKYNIENEDEDDDDECNYTIDVNEGVEVVNPHIITPEEFGEYNEYKIKTLIYYADNVLTDEDDNPITLLEMEEMIGVNSLDHFGEYEDDSVYVRDENNEIDYEILRSEKMFSEIPKIGCAN